jgi:hypothetical protein
MPQDCPHGFRQDVRQWAPLILPKPRRRKAIGHHSTPLKVAAVMATPRARRAPMGRPIRNRTADQSDGALQARSARALPSVTSRRRLNTCLK